MKIKRLPAAFVIPAQPIKASKPPSGPDWVHEIKHDGYRPIVRRDGPTVRLYSRNAIDLAVRLSAIAAAAALDRTFWRLLDTNEAFVSSSFSRNPG